MWRFAYTSMESQGATPTVDPQYATQVCSIAIVLGCRMFQVDLTTHNFGIC